MQEIYTVRIAQRWKSLKAPQQDSGVYKIKIQVIAIKEGRKQKTIDTGQQCSRDVFLSLFPKFGANHSVKRQRELKKLSQLPENIEIKKKVNDIYYQWHEVVKGVTLQNCIERQIPRLSNVIDLVEKRKTLAEIVPLDADCEKLYKQFDLYFADVGASLTKSSRNRMTSSKNSFLKYSGNQNLEFKSITKDFLTDWEKWMRGEDKYEGNKVRTFKTILGYGKDLNTILDYIIDNPMLGYSMDMKPIGKGKSKYNLPSAEDNEASIPRYLEEQDLIKFKNYKPQNEREELAKDLWFFSYYCGGINMVDLVNLRKSNIQKEHNTLVFFRTKNRNKKTKTPSRVPLTLEAKKLIDKYSLKNTINMGTQYLKNELGFRFGGAIEMKPYTNTTEAIKKVSGKENIDISGFLGGDEFYLLNFHQNSKSQKLENTASNLRSRINDELYLKSIAKKLELKESLNYQMARHTFATNLLRTMSEKDKPIRTLMSILGHASQKSTENYINKLKAKDVKKHMEKI